MTILITVIHIAVSLLLILVVLAQQGKGQDLASAFGGGGSSAAFGARGAATFLAKVTTICAVLFMLTSLGLTYLRPAGPSGTVVPADAPATAPLPGEVGEEETVPPSEGSEQPPSESGQPTEGASPSDTPPPADPGEEPGASGQEPTEPPGQR
jgi:preprotein translocase subunit SecG